MGQLQTPLTQGNPTSQRMPQAPQLAVSVAKLVQKPWQDT